MRFAARALVAVLIVVGSRTVAAEESGSKWWPFAKSEKEAVSEPQGAAATTPTAPNSRYLQSGPVQHQAQLPQSTPDATADVAKNKVNWPKLHTPEFPRPPWSPTRQQAKAAEPPRNSWVDQAPVTPKPSPWQSVKNGANRASTSTKVAWGKTVDAITPGDQMKKPESSHFARREVKPSLWKRMLGANEAELQQPQTVPEWMAQKRLDP